MRRRCMGILIFILSVSLAYFVVFTCSKKSTKQEPTPSSCSVSPVSLDFDTVTVGEYSEKSFLIRTTGTDTLTGTVIESCSDFSITPDSDNYNLAQGESLMVIVRFQPESIGDKVCVIGTGDSACSDVNCSGTGGKPPACVLSPSSIDFGIVTIGENVDTTFTITNNGGGTLTGNVNESCGDFTIVSGGGGYNLTAGQSQIVGVRFQPESIGNDTCEIETGTDICEGVLCVGFAEPAPACSVYPNNIDFGLVKLYESVDTSFTITNIGGGFLEGEISKSSHPSSDCPYYFFFLSGQGYYSLAAGESHTVKIRFAPSFPSYVTCYIGTGNTACGSVYCIGGGHY